MANRSNEKELPLLLTPEQLAEDVFQIKYDEKHISHLRRHAGLPYLQFQHDGVRIFRYPREALMQWIAKRTHGKIQQPAAAELYPVNRKRGRIAGKAYER